MSCRQLNLPIFFLLLLALWNPLYGQQRPLETVAVELRLVPKEQTFDAVIDAVNRATISAQTSGVVEAVLFDVNDYVAKGGVVVRLRDKDQQAALERAEAAHKEARARHIEAQADYSRIRQVYEKKAVSRADMDKAEASLKAAKARLDVSQAEMEQVREQLGYTVVSAPYSGIVTKRHVEVGETVQPGQALMTGISLELLRADVAVPQQVVELIREKRQARIIISDAQPDGVTAEALTFFPYANPETHSFWVRVQLPEGVAGIYPGMFVKVAFQIGEMKRLLVPAKAVAYRSEVSALYVIDGRGGLSLRQVRIGNPVGSEMVEVLAGVDEGEQIAIDPVRAAAELKRQRREARHE